MKLPTLVLGLLFCMVAHCQQNAKDLMSVSHTSGGDATSPQGSIAYSVGQVFYASMNDSSTSVLAGVQQTFSQVSQFRLEIGNSVTNVTISSYPNPMTDYLIIEIGGFNQQNFSYQIFDMKGILIENKEIKIATTKILAHTLQSATYFITVTDNGRPIKTFKIIKT